MRVSFSVASLVALIGVNILAPQCAAQSSTDVRVPIASQAPATTPKFTFILFWKEDNAASQGMAATLKTAVAKRSHQAEWTSVNVNNPAHRAVVERYHVERAPMPMVLCVAHNGAITGGITKQLTEEAVENALVTPAMAEVTKALQDKRIVVIHVQPDPRFPLPPGATQFAADPAFQARTTVVTVGLADPTEARFVKDLEIKPEEIANSTIVVLAPPGVFVGKFPASTTASQIGAALHAAGKCCNDPNCKHNQKGQ